MLIVAAAALIVFIAIRILGKALLPAPVWAGICSATDRAGSVYLKVICVAVAGFIVYCVVAGMYFPS